MAIPFSVIIGYNSLIINGSQVISSSSISFNIDTGSTVDFSNSSASSGGYTISALNLFTNNTTFTQAAGAPTTSRTNNGTAGQDSVTFQCYVVGYGTKTLSLYFNFSVPVDDYLDAITGDLGSDIPNYSTATQWESPAVYVSGVDAGVNVVATVGGTMTSKEISLNGGGYQSTPITSGLTNGGYVKVRGTTSSNYSTGTTLTVTFTAGNTVSDSVTVTTIAQPTSGGGLIAFGHATGAIPASDLRNFFIGIPENTVYAQVPSQVSISQLYKGGTYVPNITENANIPTSGEVQFSDYRNAYSSFSIDSITASKATFVSTYNTGLTYKGDLYWYILDNVFTEDVEVGYSPLYKSDIEFYCELIVNSTQNPSEPCVLTADTPTTWTHIDNTNRRFGVEKTVVSLDFTYNYGTIKVYMRRSGYNSAIDSATVAWTIQFQGP